MKHFNIKVKGYFSKKILFDNSQSHACRQVITQYEQSQPRKTETQNKIIFLFDKLKQQENHHHQTFIFIFYSYFSAHHSRSWWKLWFLFIFALVLCCSLCYAEMMSIKEYYLDDDESATVHFDNSTTLDWRGDDRLQRPDIRENEHLKSCRLGISAITRVEKLILRETGKTERDWFSRELPLINDTQDSGSSLRMRSVHVQRKSAESLFETDWEANDKVK